MDDVLLPLASAPLMSCHQTIRQIHVSTFAADSNSKQKSNNYIAYVRTTSIRLGQYSTTDSTVVYCRYVVYSCLDIDRNWCTWVLFLRHNKIVLDTRVTSYDDQSIGPKNENKNTQNTTSSAHKNWIRLKLFVSFSRRFHNVWLLRSHHWWSDWRNR